MKQRSNNTRKTKLSALREQYDSRKDAIQQRLTEFSNTPRTDYFYELLYCLMTPQTSAESAESVVRQLRRLSFQSRTIDPEAILRDRRHYIRFHKTKSKHLVRLKEDFPTVLNALATISSPSELRQWLVKHVKGLGYKEATHFLRNIGKNGGLAILDRHILRNLKRYGAIRSLPKSLSRKQYLSIEQRFMRFSEQIGIPVDELDLLFWSMETGEIRK
jgi:N-glycosylase/DNA lyase